MTLFKSVTHEIVFRSTAAGQIFFEVLRVKGKIPFTIPRNCKNFQIFLTEKCIRLEKVQIFWDVMPIDTASHPRRLESSTC
jgi:hypothetical protein